MPVEYEMSNILDKFDDESIDVEEEIAESEEDILSQKQRSRKLYIDKGEKSVSDLFRMIKEKDINLQPEFQRKFIWDKKTMSRFIESLLLSIPIPTIFLAENGNKEEYTYDVIDGQQRLSTIFSFLKEGLSDDEIKNLPTYLQEELPPFKLSGLETLAEFNSKGYQDLEEKKKKLSNVFLPVVIVLKDSSEDIKYDIFSRINRGSVKLNSQELLNVMYRGKLISAINELANLELIDNVFENRPVLKKRYGYNEIILRTIAMEQFINNDWTVKKKESPNEKTEKGYTGRLNLSVIDYLAKYRNDEREAKRIKSFIIDAFEKVKIVFGQNAFKRVNESGATSINKTIAEMQLIVLSRFDMNTIRSHKDIILSSFNDFLQKNEKDLFTRATNNTKNVEDRYKWGEMLSNKLRGL
ncbi:hypothetical protein AC245_08830 [Haemophilus parainfluenzae]|jgi:hypothetical protein|uniref:DUF262 domain-containing protein n=1 Tax=Haemophilus parainfluenzae TaxID=729 RepID=UPI0006C40823|nr:DUF262 domain-containing protein [Haemophilus parainfluenzae]KOT13341.1 hypothetical protein AC245_08830 [Haemophilus parainfluenzae]